MERVLLAVCLIAVTLAGCTGEDGDTADGAIKVLGMPSDPSTEPLRLEATVSADEYKWKMGDGRPTVTGKTIEHVYGVTDGAFRVELTTVSGGEETTHAPLSVEFGTGQNEAPDFVLSLENNWLQAGETTTLGAFGSTDPEGDPILVQWFCQRTSDIQLATAGHHGAAPGGITFGSGAAAAFPVQLVNGTEVPDADRTVSGDLCEGLSTGGFSEETAVSGAFAEPGIYEITMAAKDPVNPNVATTTTLYVTEFPRFDEPVMHTFTDTIQYSAPQQFDDPSTTAEQTGHMRSHDFEIELPINSVEISISNDGGSGGVADVTYEIRKGESVKTPETNEPLSKGAGFYSTGSYTAWVYARSGAQVEYTVEVTYEYVSDPAALFEGPH